MTTEALMICDICSGQFAHDDVIKLHDKRVCAKCKPLYLQQIREGVVDEGNAEKNYKVAYYQRRAVISLLLCCLLGFVLFIAPMVAGKKSDQHIAVLVVLLAVSIGLTALGFLMTYYVCMLAAVLSRWYMGVICFPFLLMPLIHLIVLVICSSRATAHLKKHGYKVGFVGVSKSTLKELKNKAGK